LILLDETSKGVLEMTFAATYFYE